MYINKSKPTSNVLAYLTVFIQSQNYIPRCHLLRIMSTRGCLVNDEANLGLARRSKPEYISEILKHGKLWEKKHFEYLSAFIKALFSVLVDSALELNICI